MGVEEQTLAVVLQLKDQLSSALGKAGASVDQFKQKTESLNRIGLQLGSAFKIAGGIVTAAAVAMIRDIIRTGSEIHHLSQVTGISTDSLQKLGFVAKQQGSSIESLAHSLRRLSSEASSAAHGGEEAQKLFKQAGIEYLNTNGELKDSETLLRDVADALKNTTSSTERQALAIRLLGRAGTELLPVLQGGSEALDKVSQSAQNLGIVIDEQTIKKTKEMGDQIDALEASIKGGLAKALGEADFDFISLADTVGQVGIVLYKAGGAASVLAFGWIKAFQLMYSTTESTGKAIGQVLDMLVGKAQLAYAKIIRAGLDVNPIFNKDYAASLDQIIDKLEKGQTSLSQIESDLITNITRSVAKSAAELAQYQKDVDQFVQGFQSAEEDFIKAHRKAQKDREEIDAEAERRKKDKSGATKFSAESAARIKEEQEKLKRMEEDNLKFEEEIKKSQKRIREFSRETGLDISETLSGEIIKAATVASQDSEKVYDELFEHVQEALANLKKQAEESPLSGLQLALHDLASETTNFREAFGSVFKDIKGSFSDAIAGMLEKGEDFSKGIQGFLDTIKKSFIKMVADLITQNIFKRIAGLFAPGAAQGNGPFGLNLGPMGIMAAAHQYGAPGGLGAGAGAAAGGGSFAGGGGGFNFSQIAGVGNLFASQGGGAGGGGGFFSPGGLGQSLGFLVGAGGLAFQQSAQSQGDVAGSAVGGGVGGAGIGAGIGSLFGPVGGIIGLLAGGALGGLGGFFGGKEEEKKEEEQKEQAEQAAQQQAALLAQQEAEAAKLIKLSVTTQLGGGTATPEAAIAAGNLLSADISKEEINQFGGVQAILSKKQQILGLAASNTINVGAPVINVSVGQLASGYDVQQLAQDLGFAFVNSIQGAAGQP